MNAGPIAERVYDELRRIILTHGFRPGDRLDPNQLADRLAASVTPVREALNVLCGEQLVEAHRAGGYYVPALNEPSLRDMYTWTNEVAALSLRHWRPWPGIDWDRIEDKRVGCADRAAKVLEALARSSTNGEHARAMDQLNARLHAVRVVEERVIEDVLKELVALEHALETGDKDSLRKLLTTYHRRRLRAVPELVRAVYRTPPAGTATTIEL